MFSSTTSKLAVVGGTLAGLYYLKTRDKNDADPKEGRYLSSDAVWKHVRKQMSILSRFRKHDEDDILTPVYWIPHYENTTDNGLSNRKNHYMDVIPNPLNEEFSESTKRDYDEACQNWDDEHPRSMKEFLEFGKPYTPYRVFYIPLPMSFFKQKKNYDDY